MTPEYDVLLAGGGLANSLLAAWLHRFRPDIRFLLVEKEARLGGRHTWSFHESDIPEAAWSWLGDLVTRSWEGHRVRFPSHARKLSGRYHSIVSRDLHECVYPRVAAHTLLGTRIESLSSHGMRLDDGRAISARVVLDGRGFHRVPSELVGYQKFVGLDLELEAPHGLDCPVLMDARCEQIDGFRFFYVLPWTETRVLIEDTRYSDGGFVDVPGFRAEILAYAERQGWKPIRRLGEEVGALPIPLVSCLSDAKESAAIPFGVRAGQFHPTTGYSLPYTVRAIERLSTLGQWNRDSVKRAMGPEPRGAFFRFLNRMLFLGATPKERYRILERFYRLPEGVVRRFYAGELGLADRVRILVGRPPIPLGNALGCLPERDRWVVASRRLLEAAA